MTRTLAKRLTHAMNRIDAAYYIGEQGSGITDNALCVMYALGMMNYLPQSERPKPRLYRYSSSKTISSPFTVIVGTLTGSVPEGSTISL